ncbi:HupE/UreJ family protein [Microbacterium sp. ASV49]|uniref:HupE/UreJ family protein n=1 Tax=Microbacterium candidum TaxID=3041922 RepID=A0ABT7MWZ7_9MICO|nr:HupE/UreJ family protein [Microbacterium sp. ASV49]MDL9978959.1 HupE/UreJ family protein [Microbacterium sp. ASV49]
MTPTRPRRLVAALTIVGTLIAGAAASVLVAAPAEAHVTTVAYADLAPSGATGVRATFDLQYQLLSASVAQEQNDPALFTAAIDQPIEGQEQSVLTGHAASIVDYTAARFAVSAGDVPCRPHLDGGFVFHQRDAADYARYSIVYTCGPTHDRGHVVRSSLFPDREGMVKDTKTIVTYRLDGRSGSAALDAGHPSFTTEQSWTDRFAEFFLLGANHLLTGIDHIFFLVALIISSRRLRDVVLAATCFTLAHSITFLLAALGLVHVTPHVVEPIIALSIAGVAATYLWGLRRPAMIPALSLGGGGMITPGRRDAARSAYGVSTRFARSATLEETLPRGSSGEGGTTESRRGEDPLGLNRQDLLRLAIVFCFGLVHGLGFASAIGIQEAWSWTLLWSLLVFNLGIEAVQLGIIIIVFPPLLLLRRRAPRAALWVSVGIAFFVTIFGLVWAVQRLLGVGLA